MTSGEWYPSYYPGRIQDLPDLRTQGSDDLDDWGPFELYDPNEYCVPTPRQPDAESIFAALQRGDQDAVGKVDFTADGHPIATVHVTRDADHGFTVHITPATLDPEASPEFEVEKHRRYQTFRTANMTVHLYRDSSSPPHNAFYVKPPSWYVNLEDLGYDLSHSDSPSPSSD